MCWVWPTRAPLFSNLLSKAWTLRKSCSRRAGWREKKRTIKVQWWVQKEGQNRAECWQEKLNQTSWSCCPCVSSLSSEPSEHGLPTVSHYGPTGPRLKFIKTEKKLSSFTSHNHFYCRPHFSKKYCSKHRCSQWQEVFPMILIKVWFGLSSRTMTTLSFVWEGHQCALCMHATVVCWFIELWNKK